MIAELLAVASAWLVGVLFLGALWPRDRALSDDLPLILPLGLGIGLGLTSALFFYASLLSPAPLPLSGVGELVLALGSAWLIRRRPDMPGSSQPRRSRLPWPVAVLVTVFIPCSVVALIVTMRAYAREPLGSWDGWAIWNNHARFLFFAGTDWPRTLQQPQLAWTHLDYPFLVPASVARTWAFAGHDSAFGSGLVSASFGVATVWLLVAAVARVRSAVTALVGDLVLLGTSSFVTFSSNEHADIPLGFFILATCVLLTREPAALSTRASAALVGLAAGLASWTKNEGLLFAFFIGAIGVVLLIRRRASWWLCLGLGLTLLPLLWFKFALAPANDVAGGDLLHRLSQLFVWPRHRLILASLWRDLGQFGQWTSLPFLAMAACLIGPGRRRLMRGEWLAVLLLGLMLAGYYAVYLITPWDLAWHLDSSLVRLLLQLWPLAIFLWSLALPVMPAWPGRVPAGLVVGLNLAVACAIVAGLSAQPATGELAVRAFYGGEIRVAYGEGWHAEERLGRDRWAWSKGACSLDLHVIGPEPATITLQFKLRALSRRVVTAKIGRQTVWHAAVDPSWATAFIRLPALPPGVTRLDFESDTPPVSESAAPGARGLSFTIYDLRLERK